MHELNLLPPSRRNRLEREKLLVTFSRLGHWLVVNLLILTIVAGGLAANFEMRLRQAGKGSSGPVQEEYRRLRAEVGRWNTWLDFIDSKSEKMVVWSDLLDSFLSIIPGGVTIQRIEGDRGHARLIFSGQAQTRHQLVILEQALQALPWVASVAAPHTNLLLPTNPRYEFTLILKGVVDEGVVDDSLPPSSPPR